MLPKKYRLTVSQFNNLSVKSNDFNSESLNIRIKEGENNKFPKFVFVVPKKLDNRSTKRHLAKRIIAEAIRKQLLSIRIPVSMLVRARKIVKKTDRLNVEKEVKFLFTKANVI